MPKRPSTELADISVDSDIGSDNEEGTDVIFTPRNDTSDVEELQNDSEENDTVEVDEETYQVGRIQQNSKAKKLLKSHNYQWVDGEKKYDSVPVQEIFFIEKIKEKAADKSPVELFEMFFCDNMKNYMIEASTENGLDIDIEKLNDFFGICIYSITNGKKSFKDYWSTDEFLHSEVVSNVMSRNTFINIKSKLKTSKSNEKNESDRIWRVRQLSNLFRINLQQFGFFASVFAIDEMMIKFFGRTVLKQFMRLKPVRFGIKLWALCTIFGFLLDFDIYCGKTDNSDNDNLSCALGSRVVLKMLHEFFEKVDKNEWSKYHACFDNYFTSPDLLVYLKNKGLKCTGTVRDKRVMTKEMFSTDSGTVSQPKAAKTKKATENPERKRFVDKHKLSKKSPRGTYVVSHDKSSGLNYVTVVDSKPVSFLTTATGETPLAEVRRFDRSQKQKVSVSVPSVFSLYNSCMGFVDLQDQHCSDLEINIGGKKWTWAVLKRFIQMALSNGLITYNLVNKEKLSAKDFSLHVARSYLSRSSEDLSTHLKIQVAERRRLCTFCPVRTISYCFDCKNHMCNDCFDKTHNIQNTHKKVRNISQKVCKATKECKKRTAYSCSTCNINICLSCFENFHASL